MPAVKRAGITALLLAMRMEVCADCPPPVLLNPSCPDGSNAVQVLQAWPGDYLVQSSTNLAGAWNDEAAVSIDTAGSSAVQVPLTGRSPLFLRGRGMTPSDGVGCRVQILTVGGVFEPAVYCEAGGPSGFSWIWSDGTTCTNRPEASKDFGMAGARMQGLLVEPETALTGINLGFDGADGGDSTPVPHRAAQNVAAVRFAYPLTGLRWWCSSYNPITNTLDFSGFTSLRAIECFNCSVLQHVVVTNLPALERVCFEDCDLQELDLSGNPDLGDVRGALNAYSAIVVGRGTGPKIWHWCTRDNPQLTQSFRDIMTNFYSLRELYIWNDNQHGVFGTGSTNLTDVQVFNNHFTGAAFTSQPAMVRCNISGNDLTNLAVADCPALEELDASANQLSSNVLDSVLADLDADSPVLRTVNLSGNAERPSATGYLHYTNLVSRGVTVTLDWPPDTNEFSGGISGGTNAITFVTTNRISHMEIRTAAGTPESILWHWADGETSSGVLTAGHDFRNNGCFTNYVEVIPPTCVTYFGAEQGYTQQGIRGVFGAAHFPNLEYLFLYQESLKDLVVAGCSHLIQLHLADNPVSTAVCDQWFIDLDATVTGSVSEADFYYPSSRRSSVSDAAWSNLAARGYSMHPF